MTLCRSQLTNKIVCRVVTPTHYVHRSEVALLMNNVINNKIPQSCSSRTIFVWAIYFKLENRQPVRRLDLFQVQVFIYVILSQLTLQRTVLVNEFR